MQRITSPVKQRHSHEQIYDSPSVFDWQHGGAPHAAADENGRAAHSAPDFSQGMETGL